MRRTLMMVLAAALVAGGCGDEDEKTLSSGPEPGHEAEMFRTVLTHLTAAKNLPKKGDWPDDFGDANFYGPAFFYRYAKAGSNPLQEAVGHDNHKYNMELLADSLADAGKLVKNLEGVMMSLFGLMERYHHSADTDTKATLDKAIDVINLLAKTMDYYPEGTSSVGGYGVDTYGPTTTNATLALVSLEYAALVGGDRKAQRIQDALKILDTGRTKAFIKDKGYYQFSSKISGLYLYPNITQLISHVRAYELTKKKVYLDRANDLHKAIQGLKVAGEGRYRSPYSAKYMGAKTDDYTTLSSQNFTMIGLSLLYQQTGAAGLKQEVADILKFIRTRLLSQGRVLHHWMDGKLAVPADPEYYCSGCNLQMLYIIWRLGELLGG